MQHRKCGWTRRQGSPRRERGRRARRGRTAGLAVALLLAAGGAARAEVAACVQDGDANVLIMAGITEGPDPIPQYWLPVREHVDPVLLLNPDGASDGRPHFAYDPTTGAPHVVWAHDVAGVDFDVAYSTWGGTQWTPPQFLTSRADDELDPRIHAADGALYVVWWVPGPDRVFLSQRARGELDWSIPEQVGLTGNAGRRPAVVEYQDTVLVAAERSTGGGSKDVLVSTEGQTGFTTEVVATAPQSAPLNVMLHLQDGRLWMDWRHSDAAYAYSEFDGDDWKPAVIVPWAVNDWIDYEEIRLIIRNLVLAD
jgi:hypothetical protein